MKKIVSYVLILSMMLCLVGCSKKETETTYLTNLNGEDVKLTLYAKGDVINKIVQVGTLSLDGYSQETIDLIQSSADQLIETYNAIDGVTYTADLTNNVLTETFNMDVSNKDTLKALIDQNILPVTNKDGEYLSLVSTKRALESAGYTLSK